MIGKVYIDGFRSLSSFNMSLKPGLNMLVGPNGAGKTNIILFFEFLSHLSFEPLAEAISKCGGAGYLFQKTSENTFCDQIKSEIEGEIHEKNRSGNIISIRYKFDFNINISEERDTIYYKRQRLRIYRLQRDKKKGILEFDIECSISDENEISVYFNKIDLRKYRNLDIFRFSEDDRMESRSERVSRLENQLKRQISGDINLISPLQRFKEEFSFVLSDLVGGEAFNVMPSVAREAEDSATPPGIRKDGAGLASTLYALKKIDADPRYRRRFPRYAYSYVYMGPFSARVLRRTLSGQSFYGRKGTFNQIVDFVKLLNDQILDIQVILDHSDNKFKISATIAVADGELKIPFSLLSDGTVKWVALITAIFTYSSIFAIEEPENFIHPLMQREVVKIMRESSKKENQRSFVLMTTHSETLLNAAVPDEILVVSMKNGVTVANRPKNAKMLCKEIEDTGFGLGHYYLSGALEND